MRIRDHLDRLEAESIFILREAVAEARNPVMLFSAGKDSAAMLHLAKKAFAPAAPPFSLLNIDTGWKFAAMYTHRDRAVQAAGMELIVHRNPDAIARDINPFDHGALHTELWKTEGLKQALDAGGFDVAFGGARRDEEKSRAKERIFSVRGAGHRWEPRAQRPELWSLFNTRLSEGQSLRVFPLSNWTEIDIWDYIAREEIELVDLYFAAPRPVVERDGRWIVVDDDRFRLEVGETPETRTVRFRTLGCYPLSCAIESDAKTVDDIVAETRTATTSERDGRLIDRDGGGGGMERKKREGYF